MNQPFFSIIIPALNEEKYLPNLLKDLSSQSYRDFEVIVVDGKSIDKTVPEAKKFTRKLPKLTILTSPRRHVCTQRNLGAGKAKGEYFIFMDADDRLPPYFLLGLKYQLEANPSHLATTFCGYTTTSTTELSIANSINAAQEFSQNLKYPFFLEAVVVISKLLFVKIGGFDENVDYSEGAKLVHMANNLGYKHSIYHEPRYSYSLRRIKKFGLAKMMTNVTRLQLSLLFEQKLTNSQIEQMYPMRGGTLFQKPPISKAKQFTHTIDKILHSISVNDKPLTLKILKKQLNSLLS